MRLLDFFLKKTFSRKRKLLPFQGDRLAFINTQGVALG